MAKQPAQNAPMKIGPVTENASATPTGGVRRLFTWQEWCAAGIAFLISGATYLYYLTPEVTLQDSGELVTGAFNFGVPHPTGYPLWAFLGFVWRLLIPFGNPAWRIGLMSAVTGAALVGILTLVMSRSILMLLRNSPWNEQIEEPLKEWLSLVVATAVAMIFAFNRGVWLWACVPEMRVLNVFSFILLSCVFFAWMMRPEKHRYLYATLLLFGLSLTNHQTIVVMALPLLVGAFVVGALGERTPGRFSGFLELLFAFLVAWAAVVTVNAWLLATPTDSLFNQNVKALFLFGPQMEPLLLILVAGGGAAALLITGSQAGWLSWRRALWCAGLFVLGCSFYLYMPLASSTNPPMNWGYAATKQGFLHSITRGQYEQLHTSTVFGREFLLQVQLFTQGIFNQYSWVVAIFGVIPAFVLFGMWHKLKSRGRQWLIYSLAAFATTSFGLIMIINPGLDKTQQEIILKFFAPAHGFFTMLIGYGIAFVLAWALARFREKGVAWALSGASVVVFVLGVAARLVIYKSQQSVLPFVLECIDVAIIAGWVVAVLSLVVAKPAWSKVSCLALVALAIIPFGRNWATCEQRGHDFGYQFGYRMFYPGGDYPPMEKDAFLFGGTDPGRFVPTYMIFCESAVPPRDKYRDPNLQNQELNFDRRDVYIVTQNALADTTYMAYIRDHYDYSRPTNYNWFARWLGRPFTYPKEPLYIPTNEDSQRAFQEYVTDVQARRARGEPMDPDEAVDFAGGRVQVRGVKGVMNINGILCRWIHERNKAKHEFYIEESYVIPWMYPYLEPYGIIMKLSKEPLPAPADNAPLWSDLIRRDRAYWDKLVNELTHRPEFWRDNDARKTFSKLRSAIGGIYAYRKLFAEAQYAFEQSRALCPDSPEANFRTSQLLLETGQPEKAITILEEYQKLDPLNSKIGAAIQQIRAIQQTSVSIQQLEQTRATQPHNLQVVAQLAQAYVRMQQFERIPPIFDSFLAQPEVNAGEMLQIAQFYLQVGQAARAVSVVEQATQRFPKDGEGFYALAILRGASAATNEALAALEKALQLNPALRDRARADQNLAGLRSNLRFQTLVQGQ